MWRHLGRQEISWKCWPLRNPYEFAYKIFNVDGANPDELYVNLPLICDTGPFDIGGNGFAPSTSVGKPYPGHD